MKSHNILSWLSATLILGAFGLLTWLERRRPLRREVEPKLTRTTRNLAVAAIGALALQLTERPVALELTALVERQDLGLLRFLRLPLWLETVLAVVLLDYTLYVWHVLTHKIPFLWRFHVAHHVDLDLDASTALRFHFGELVLSVPWRAAQLIIIGVSPIAYSTWQTFVFLSIMFHHSIVREETNSNWSSGLTIWDRLHGTLRLNVPQDKITIGVPAYREPEDVELLKILPMPFGEQRPAWQLPDDGEPHREALPVPPDNLLA